jgi:hypothetical protein
MSKIEGIEGQVEQLTAEELRAFRAWFERFDADAFDREIESDVVHGKLDELADRALLDYKAERDTNL